MAKAGWNLVLPPKTSLTVLAMIASNVSGAPMPEKAVLALMDLSTKYFANWSWVNRPDAIR